MDSTASVSPTDRIDLPGLLCPNEVASLLSASERTVRRLAEEGVLERVRIGHRTSRYTVRSVRALIDPENSDAPVRKTEATPNAGRQPRHASV